MKLDDFLKEMEFEGFLSFFEVKELAQNTLMGMPFQD